MTAGAVSQQIHLLQDRLGAVLFERVSRGVVLTEVGRRYAAQLRVIFNSLEQATDAIVAPTRQTLVIGVTPRFGTKWLFPRLPDFQQANATVEVELRSSLNAFDFVRDRIDVAFRHGRPLWPGMEIHLLFSEELTPVCSPDLLTGVHPLRSPEDLQHHRLLYVGRGIEEWPEWLSKAGVNPHVCKSGSEFESLRLALDVAAAGLGVALGRLPLVADELRSGQLVAPFDLRVRSKSAYYLVYPEESAERPKIRAFRDWVLYQLNTEAST